MTEITDLQVTINGTMSGLTSGSLKDNSWAIKILEKEHVDINIHNIANSIIEKSNTVQSIIDNWYSTKKIKDDYILFAENELKTQHHSVVSRLLVSKIIQDVGWPCEFGKASELTKSNSEASKNTKPRTPRTLQ